MVIISIMRVYSIQLAECAITIVGQKINYNDAAGNILGLLGLYLTWKHNIFNWFAQIASAIVLIFTYYHAHLLGGVGKQLIILSVSCYGLYTWNKNAGITKKSSQIHSSNILPPVRWANWCERICMIIALTIGTAICVIIFRHWPQLSWNPWPDAYIFVASLLATITLALRLIDFWILWLAVDVVGVPLAYASHLVFSALVYGIYFILVVIGLYSWITLYRNQKVQ